MLRFDKPTFSAEQAAKWLSENVSAGGIKAYYSSMSNSMAKYRSDDHTSWHVTISGGGMSPRPTKIIIELPEEYVNGLISRFREPDSRPCVVEPKAIVPTSAKHVPEATAKTGMKMEKQSTLGQPKKVGPVTYRGMAAKDSPIYKTPWMLCNPSSSGTAKTFEKSKEKPSDSINKKVVEEEGETGPNILMEREQTGFCSTFTEYLGLERVGTAEWRLGAYQNNCISPEDIPEEVLFPNFEPEEEGDEPDWDDVELPISWEGHNLIEMIDDGFLTDELVPMDKGVRFNKHSLRDALKYCQSKKWHQEDDFEECWLDVMRAVGAIE